MSDAVQIALIVAMPPTLLALATLIQVIGNARQTRGLRRDVNGRLSELLEQSKAAARAEGQLSVVLPPPPPPPPPPPSAAPPHLPKAG